MPRAYSPNLRTVQRAAAVCDALGVTRWHLAAGPDVWYWSETPIAGRTIVRLPLRTLESYAAGRAQRDAGRSPRPEGDRDAYMRGWQRRPIMPGERAYAAPRTCEHCGRTAPGRHFCTGGVHRDA